ncbi:MAG: diaminopimelate decarboxylase, partial [Solirubrobacterales bacterium]|nr:diaminopimelate decarboxylase [Solirubrobacterales bacterium]
MPGAQKDAAAAVAAADGPRHDPVAASPVYPQGSRVNEHGHLEVGGCDVVELLAEHGSPAYIYAEDDIRARAGAYLDAFSARSDDFEVLFASKALPCTAAYATFAELGLSVDVASGGELAMALAGGFDPARIYMHGNNKTEHELREAIAAVVGHLIVDSFDEIERLERLLAEAGASQDVMIRVTPGIKASTHSYVQTGQLDSKFGFGIEDGLAEEAVRRVVASERLTLVGLHAHIGSQIFELEPYTKAIEVL